MIVIVWPTVRPQTFKEVHKLWMDRADHPENIRTIVAVNNYEQAHHLTDYDIPIDDIEVTYSERRGVVDSAYLVTKDLKAEPDDIIILASDDMYAPKHWDTWLLQRFNGFDGCLVVDDGFQYGPKVTLPILTFSCLEKLNKAIYHPSYFHLFSDEEMFHNVKDLGLMKVTRNTGVIFEHKHYGNSKRKRDDEDNKAKVTYQWDQNNFNERMKLPVEDRIKI